MVQQRNPQGGMHRDRDDDTRFTPEEQETNEDLRAEDALPGDYSVEYYEEIIVRNTDDTSDDVVKRDTTDDNTSDLYNPETGEDLPRDNQRR